MVIFGCITGGLTAFGLLYFFLRGRFPLPEARPEEWLLWTLLCAALLSLPLHWAIGSALALLAAFLMAWLFCRAPWYSALVSGLLFSALHLGATALTFGLQQLLAQQSPTAWLLVRQCILYLLTVVLSPSLCRWRSTPRPLLRTIPLILVMVLLCVLSLRNTHAAGMAMMEVFSFLWLLYAAVLLQQIAQQLDKAQQALLSQQQMAHQYTMQEEYYQQLLEKQTQTRALWHDLDKYLRAAKAETAPSEALKKLEALLDDATAILDVGNPVLNVILNEYAQTARAFGIELRLKVQVPAELFVSAADLYVLIGNTMDNAIEACRCLPQSQRFMELTLRTQHEVVYYQLANPYDAQLKSVPRGAMHGHGLENARHCVKKYNGLLLTQQDHGFFIVSAHMNQPPNWEH